MTNLVSNLLSRCDKLRGLESALRDHEDENEIMQGLREAHRCHNNFGCCCAAEHLRAKVANSKQVRLRLMLKCLKKY